MKNRNQMKQSIATMQDKEKILDNKEMCMVVIKKKLKFQLFFWLDELIVRPPETVIFVKIVGIK